MATPPCPAATAVAMAAMVSAEAARGEAPGGPGRGALSVERRAPDLHQGLCFPRALPLGLCWWVQGSGWLDLAEGASQASEAARQIKPFPRSAPQTPRTLRPVSPVAPTAPHRGTSLPL